MNPLEPVRRAVRAAPDRDGVQAQMLAFCEAHPDALDRSCRHGHFTASAAVVDPDRSHVLLLLHRKLGRWLQPGGHADGDNDLARVALREATEETGLPGLRVVGGPIDLDVHPIPARPGEPEHLHLDVRYLIEAPVLDVPPGNHESIALRWVSLEDAAGMDLDLSTRRLLGVALG